ncbi:MAG: GDP-mannose 4,6-dehydratase [Candidatus Chisholmbacteria bacterium RIFCSPLOWO2_01_FULL_49_14]|jgi:GDPmannose 4,6-dehydratase|uniref:GDP-mannose 4,6-dehydratase n=1 Tax=Candidatus Chisholmbacteria bacterium RIFCSPLOWO2_01_FULL_49_14 TaxID=1797593 RepID=A0A1G1W3Z8_9BACT|nr:MAG: GDP-mannose 4,6-dehydratase [Candidatus Chisholmbacteria bacterium RIFCSPLOWO2_01_FULL_49_14]
MAKRKVAFITGIAGQDGSYLADFLLEKGYKVAGLMRRTSNIRRTNITHLLGKISIEFGDLLDYHTLESAIKKHQPDEVYNLAAQSVPADSWTHPIYTGEVTALGVTRMLEAVRSGKPDAKFYQGSSREVFGGARHQVCNEETPYLANNPYGVAKVYGHLITRTYRESYGMFACGGILFNHESPRRGLHFVTRKITMGVACIKLGIANPPLNEAGEPLVIDGKLLLGNLEAKRDWGYAKEYVEAMWLMLQRKEPEDYVIATNSLNSVKDFCKSAFEQVGLNWKDHVRSHVQFTRPTEITASRGDYSKAKKELGWEPKTGFQDLVKLMVEADLERLSR